jgi:hypothetical protein
MAYKYNPLLGIGLDETGAGASAFEVLGTVATVGDLPGGATQGDVYLVEADDNFYVWDGSAWASLGTLAGPQGPAGATGPAGADGADGVGVITGGTTGQVLAKASNTDYDTEWVDQTGGGGTPGGSDTQVQFNDGGAFGGDPGLTYDKTTDKLTVGGDLELENGGTFTTTLQTVTPTANRTVSIPDATGTIGLVNGPTGSIQFNQAGALSGTSDFSTTLNWNNATTTFTGLKLNVTDTASAADSKLLDLQAGGTSYFSITSGTTNFFDINSSVGAVTFRTGGASILRFYGPGFGTQPLYVDTLGGINIRGAMLNSDADDILALRNGTNAQTYRLYNTYTDASNYERTSITRDSSGLVIDAQKGGTGVDPTNLLDVQQANTSFFKVVAGAGSGSVTLQRANTPVLTLTQSGGGFVGLDPTRLYFSASGGVGTVGLAPDSAGVVKVTDGSTGTGYLKLIPTTVSALTAAATVGAGTKAFVTDSTSTLSSHHGQAVVGGGTNFVPVFSDGTNWIVG